MASSIAAHSSTGNNDQTQPITAEQTPSIPADPIAEEQATAANPKFATLLEQWRKSDSLKFEVNLGGRMFDIAHFFDRCYGKVKEDPEGSIIFGNDVCMKWLAISPAEVYNEEQGVDRSSSSSEVVEGSYRDFANLSVGEKLVYYVESELRRSYVRLFLEKLGFRKIPYEQFDLYFNNAVKATLKGAKKTFMANAEELKGYARVQFKELQKKEKADYVVAWGVLCSKIDEFIEDRRLTDTIPFDIKCKELFSPTLSHDAILPIPSPRILGATVLPTWSKISAKGCFIDDLNWSKLRSTSCNAMWNKLSIVDKASYYRRALVKRDYLSSLKMEKKKRVLEKSYLPKFKYYQELVRPNESNSKEMDALELAFLGLPQNAHLCLKEFDSDGFWDCLDGLKREVNAFYEVVRVEDMRRE